MAEASKRFYRVQIALIVVGAVLLFGPAQLLWQGQYAGGIGFGASVSPAAIAHAGNDARARWVKTTGTQEYAAGRKGDRG